MSTLSTIFRRALIFAILVSLLVPAAGFAHALFADHIPNRPVLEYVWIGFWHMVGGWDHLLFSSAWCSSPGSSSPPRS